MRLCLFALLLASTQAVAAPSVTPQQALQEGKLAYQRRDYGKVRDLVQPLLYPSLELSKEDDVVDAHKILGLSYLFLKEESKAQDELMSLLNMRPDYQLDEVTDPPKAVAYFNGLRQKQEDKLRELKRLQREDEERQRKIEERRRAEAKARAERVFIERQVVRRSRLIAMLPFGIGQWQNGHRGAAIAFGVLQAAVGALSLGTWIAVGQAFPAGEFQPGQKPLAETLTGLQLGSGAAFWGLVIAGIIDAQVRLKPESIIEREIQKPRPKASISISPFGVTGAF